MTVRNVLIDTDMGPMAAAATRWLLRRRSGVRVVGVSAAWGAHSVTRCADLVEKALDETGHRGIPLVPGVDRNTRVNAHVLAFYRDHVGAGTVVLALGPLTTIAAVGPLVSGSERVVVVGGSAATGVAETVRRDPLAAARVLSSGSPITVLMSGTIARSDLAMAAAVYAADPSVAHQWSQADVRVLGGRLSIREGAGSARIVTAVEPTAMPA